MSPACCGAFFMSCAHHLIQVRVITKINISLYTLARQKVARHEFSFVFRLEVRSRSLKYGAE
jgi:hypothetical protein